MRIAVIGFHPGVDGATPPEHVRVGRMIVERLARGREHTLAIWPQVTADLDWIAEIWAENCHSHRSAAHGADMVLLAMENIVDLRAVLFSAGQAVAELAKPGATILDMSGLPPGETSALPHELARYGVQYLAISIEDGGLIVRASDIRLRLHGHPGVVEGVVPLLEEVTTHLFTNA